MNLVTAEAPLAFTIEDVIPRVFENIPYSKTQLQFVAENEEVFVLLGRVSSNSK